MESYDTSKCATYFANGEYKIEGNAQTSGFSSYTNGDVIGIAVDTTQSPAKIWFAKNNTWQGTGNPTTAGYSLTSGLDYYFMVLHGSGSSSTTASSNFGQRPFSYTPPTGFNRLNTFNLPTPTIGATASTQANKYMDATLYTGNGSTNTITNSGSMQPDLLWTKSRSNAHWHYLQDAVRGVNKAIFSNATDAEYSISPTTTALNSNGFSFNGAESGLNANGATYVGWQWNAGGSTVTNTSGSISSQVRANTSAGFSIVTYTGNATIGATIGHGLGVAPSMLIVKQRAGGLESWQVYHSALGATQYLQLNSNIAAGTNINRWNNTAPTSTVFTVYNDTINNGNTNTYVAYCFAAVAGYSAFGSFTGNGSTDGPFLYLGFRPRYILIKRTNDVSDWWIWDTARNTINVMDSILYPNDSAAEYTSSSIFGVDALSNGFKMRTSNSVVNGSSQSYIYMAFAESPFKYANAR